MLSQIPFQEVQIHQRVAQEHAPAIKTTLPGITHLKNIQFYL